MSSQPVGLEDFTFPVTIVGQLIASLQVDIVAQSITTLKVDIAAQSIGPLNINIAHSDVTLNVYVTNATLAVNVVGTVNVNIASASTTLNVNISAQTVTVSTFIQDFRPTISFAGILEKGDRIFADGTVQGGSITIYTVPAGKRAYLFYIQYYMRNLSSTLPGGGGIKVVAGTETYLIVCETLGELEIRSRAISGGIARLDAGDSVVLEAGADIKVYATIHVLEFTV